MLRNRTRAFLSACVGKSVVEKGEGGGGEGGSSWNLMNNTMFVVIERCWNLMNNTMFVVIERWNYQFRRLLHNRFVPGLDSVYSVYALSL